MKFSLPSVMALFGSRLAAFHGVLRRGTPIAQCFPVPRSTPELVFDAFDAIRQAAYSSTVGEVLSKPGVYRKRFRVKRPRSAAK